MAITIGTATSDYVNYGDVELFDGATAVSFYLELTPSSFTSGRFIINKWSNGATEEVILISLENSNEIGFLVGQGTGYPARYGFQTTSADLQTGKKHRICCTWSYLDMDIFVDGVNQPKSSWLSGTVSAIGNTAIPLTLGLEPNASSQGQEGDYEHFAGWTRKLTEKEAIELTAGKRKPSDSPNSLVIYDPLTTTASRDIVGKLKPTHTGTENSQYTKKYYDYDPNGPKLLPGDANQAITSGAAIRDRWAGQGRRY